MFQFQYELIFTCAYACRNMIMMKPVHCSHSLSICAACDYNFNHVSLSNKSVCSLRTSLWTKISAPTYHSPEHFSAALFSTTFSATRSGSAQFYQLHQTLYALPRRHSCEHLLWLLLAQPLLYGNTKSSCGSFNVP